MNALLLVTLLATVPWPSSGIPAVDGTQSIAPDSIGWIGGDPNAGFS